MLYQIFKHSTFVSVLHLIPTLEAECVNCWGKNSQATITSLTLKQLRGFDCFHCTFSLILSEFSYPVIHFVCRDVLDDGMNALAVNRHGEDLISRLMLKTNAFGCALETVGNTGQSAGLDNLEKQNKKGVVRSSKHFTF